MSAKNNVEVNIDGRSYTLCGYESEEYLQKVADFINKKISECKASEGFRRLNIDTQQIMIHLNVADDYFKAKKQADTLEAELESKDKEIYDFKHEMISAQINVESLQQENKELKESIEQYQKQVQKLESEIEELLK